MLTNAQIQIIDNYVPAGLFDVKKLKKYLNTHETVGNEVFAYCDRGKGSRSDRGNHSYSHWLDDEYGFNPVPAITFIRRIPFYFYVPDYEKTHHYGSIEDPIYSIYSGDGESSPETLEKLYEELEYLFYKKRFSLDQIFTYLIDQYGVVNAPFLSWAEYIHICDDLGWNDYFPTSFISKYNMALEALGREPIIYEVEEQPYATEMFYRNGINIEFTGRFPTDEEGNPVLRWTNVKVKNAVKISCNQVKSRSNATLRILLSPETVIYGMNFFNSWTKDEWYQVYAGPQLMEFDYTTIKERRKSLGFTQKEVADAIGTTVRTYQKWESGETTPDGHYLLRLMNWLDMPDPQFVILYKSVD